MMDGGDAWLPPSHLWDVGLVASSAKEGRWGSGYKRWRSTAAQPLMPLDLALGSLLWQPNKSAVVSGPNEAVWVRLGQIKLVWRSGVPKICQRMCDHCVKHFQIWGALVSLMKCCLWSSTVQVLCVLFVLLWASLDPISMFYSFITFFFFLIYIKPCPVENDTGEIKVHKKKEK